MRRLYRFRSTLTEESVNKIIENLDSALFDAFKELVYSIDYVEFVDERGFESSLCSLSEIELDQTKKLMDAIYGSDRYRCEDVTSDVIMGRHELKSIEEGKEEQAKQLMQRHMDEYLTKDDVLDKISELGMDSLTNTDYKILES